MAAPLSELSPSRFNTRSSSPTAASHLTTASGSPTDTKIHFHSPMKSSNGEDDENTLAWHDPRSSPFPDTTERENVTASTSPIKTNNSVSCSRDKSPTPMATSAARQKGLKNNFDIFSDLADEDAAGRDGDATMTIRKTISAISSSTGGSHTFGLDGATNMSPPSHRKSVGFSSPHKADTASTFNPADDLRENEGLTIAIDHMELSSTTGRSADVVRTHDVVTSTTVEEHNIDDSCFSAFSEVPNADMTAFARMGTKSPLKAWRPDIFAAAATPRSSRPGSSLATRTTPRSHDKYAPSESDTTELLMDFTAQLDALGGQPPLSPSKRRSPIKSQTQPDLLSYIHKQRSPKKGGGGSANYATPHGKQSILNLLDFELPPVPTPRSIPTITIRELESLKSEYLSEISTLKATLSGKYAEVESLKKAMGDAERRVGETQEALREERSAKEHAEKEKADWETKGREVEKLLQTIKADVINSEKTTERLEHQLEDAERRTVDAQAAEARANDRATDAERKVAAMASTAATGGGSGASAATADYIAAQVQRELDEKIGAISGELHAIYKKKHETKVATLKKSYEGRAERRCGDLQARIDELARANEELQLARDATFSAALPPATTTTTPAITDGADLRLLEEQRQEIELQKARLAGLAEEVNCAREEHANLLRELERERVEKGELVAAVDEMLELQAEGAIVSAGAAAVANGPAHALPHTVTSTVPGHHHQHHHQHHPHHQPHPHAPPAAAGRAAAAIGVVEDFRRSIGRPSGLRAPGTTFAAAPAADSRIGRFGSVGLSRANSGAKSRMMSNIERMGNGSGRGEGA